MNDSDRLLHQMLVEGYLEEYGIQSQNSQYPTDMIFIKQGPQAEVRQKHTGS